VWMVDSNGEVVWEGGMRGIFDLEAPSGNYHHHHNHANARNMQPICQATSYTRRITEVALLLLLFPRSFYTIVAPAMHSILQRGKEPWRSPSPGKIAKRWHGDTRSGFISVHVSRRSSNALLHLMLFVLTFIGTLRSGWKPTLMVAGGTLP
jgi:hypothetical protein